MAALGQLHFPFRVSSLRFSPLRLLLLLLCIGARPAVTLAQLTIVNPSDRTVSLAVGFYVEKGLFKGWNTKGWFTVAPHDSTSLLPGGITGGGFYYYGRIDGCDEQYLGSYGLYVHPTEAFSIASAASDVPVTLNEGAKKAPFVRVDVPAGQTRYRLRLPAVNCSRQGQRTGDWLVYLDRDKEEVTKPAEAAYVRRVTYQQGRPTGLVRDYYYPSNVLQWDGKLLQEHPLTPQGTCLTYDETGRKREEDQYQNGRPVSQRRWDATGKEVVVTKKYRTVRVLEPQQGYLFSYYNTGSSRTVIPIKLPPNTVSWYYEFSAYRDQVQLEAAKARFQLASQLTRLVDESGALKIAMQALTTPPGGHICNTYLLNDTRQVDVFRANQQPAFVREGTRTNLTSGIVPVTENTSGPVYLGLYNPDNLYGIHYAVEVVAVVEE
jgi:antitoxin component YwqK of YwqJK toxin-antitoxin module/uncharacterized membrane protein